MSYTQVGVCPVCGAPIYAPTVWSGTTPPLPIYTCVCRLQKVAAGDFITSAITMESKAENKEQLTEEKPVPKKVTSVECEHWTVLGHRQNYGECCYFPIPFWAIEPGGEEIYSGDDMASFCDCFKKRENTDKERSDKESADNE